MKFDLNTGGSPLQRGPAPFGTHAQFFVIRDGEFARDDDPAHRDVLVVSAVSWNDMPPLTIIFDERRLVDMACLQRSMGKLVNELGFAEVRQGNLLTKTGEHFWWVLGRWEQTPQRKLKATVENITLINWPQIASGTESVVFQTFGNQGERAIGMAQFMRGQQGVNGIDATGSV